MPLQMKLTAVTLDCPDPLALAAFYRQATGYAPHPNDNADFAGLAHGDGLFIGFQRVDDYEPPRWPDQTAPQQFHLDFKVPDLKEAETLLLGLGATKPPFQPGGERWLVLLDPVGHPFCVVGVSDRGVSEGGVCLTEKGMKRRKPVCSVRHSLPSPSSLRVA